MKYILSLFFLTFSAILQSNEITSIENNENNLNIELKLKLEAPAVKNSFIINLTDPNLKLSSHKINCLDEENKQKNILNNNCKLDLEVKKSTNFKSKNFNILISYQNSKTRQFKQIKIPIKLKINSKKESSEEKPSEECCKEIEKKDDTGWYEKINNYIQNLVTKSGSLWIQLLAVFILGILMSLTPCIYPMIPITAGVLQSYGSKSFLSNLLASSLYALGIATTFSIFGLISASTGLLLGNLLTNPFFIIFMVLILGYMALTMIGVFEMYIPSFLQFNVNSNKKWGIWSAYPFGILSGSVTSPCLTPGLALLLTMVAAIANKFLGFILLFTAGIGLAFPLLIIGTFSSSLTVLPKAGYWMEEVKKIFGFVLFGMCIFFISKVVPWWFTLTLLSIFFAILGIYYFLLKIDKKSGKILKILISIACLVLSFNFGISAIQEFMWPTTNLIDTRWEETLDVAISDAKILDKKIFIDVTADFCSICKLIDKKILNNKNVFEKIKSNYIPLKINASNNQKDYDFVQKNYKVIGVPTLLIIDPKNMKLIKKWDSEVYKLKPEEFEKEI